MRNLTLALIGLFLVGTQATAQDRSIRESIEWCDVWVTAAKVAGEAHREAFHAAYDDLRPLSGNSVIRDAA